MYVLMVGVLVGVSEGVVVAVGVLVGIKVGVVVGVEISVAVVVGGTLVHVGGIIAVLVRVGIKTVGVSNGCIS